MHSEQDLKHAAAYREEIHTQALRKVRAVYPNADHVVDFYPADAYFQKVWDYPGQWYTIVGTPPGAGSRKNLVDTIVRQTLEEYRASGTSHSDDAFYSLHSEYDAAVCDFCLIGEDNPSAAEAFPYRGVDSHKAALACAAKTLFEDGKEWSYDLSGATCRKLSSKALFAPVNADEWLNYRRAFLCPPHETPYSDSDFDRLNAALFPGGTDELEVYRWTTDWSDYFDDGHEWWGALCLSVYDKTLRRFVIILASATD